MHKSKILKFVDFFDFGGQFGIKPKFPKQLDKNVSQETEHMRVEFD